MAEQRSLRSPQPAAALVLVPAPNQAGILISWGKAVAETIEIRHRHIEVATEGCWINVELVAPPEHDALLAFSAQVRGIPPSRPGRPAI
jgi:hypothetical protein